MNEKQAELASSKDSVVKVADRLKPIQVIASISTSSKWKMIKFLLGRA